MTRKAAPDDRLARRLGLRGAPHGWIGLAVLILMISALIFATTATASAIRPLTVSLTFDDGRANQMTAQQLLKNHGMVRHLLHQLFFHRRAGGTHDSRRP